MIMSFLELGMLLSFFASWPASIYRSYKSRSTKGKSIVFLWFLVSAYVFGITNKLVYFPGDYVIYFYIINLSMVFIDIFLYFRNRKIEKIEEKSLATPS
jgi:hypothetical protein